MRIKVEWRWQMLTTVFCFVAAITGVISAVGNWRAEYLRGELMRRVAAAEKQALSAVEWAEYLRQKVECLSLAKEQDRQKCIP